MKNLILFFLILAGLQVQAGFISQTNIFSGEVASNLTVGAPLVVSSTGKVTTGINYTEVSATSATTTTSASDGVMTTMTTTPGIVGTYFVAFSATCINNTGTQTVTFSIYNNGVQKTDSVRVFMPGNGALSSISQNLSVSTNGIVTTTVAGAVAIEWHVSGGTGTCTQRTLNLVRLQ
jgi:hypothetical protein